MNKKTGKTGSQRRFQKSKVLMYATKITKPAEFPVYHKILTINNNMLF